MLKRRSIGSTGLCLGAAVFLAVACNLAFWRVLTGLVPVTSLAELGFLASTGIVLVALLFLSLQLFAFPFVLRPVLVVALLIAAVCAHFMGAYGVVIDREMVRNVLETDVREVRELLTPALALHVLLLGLLPAFVVTRLQVRYGSLRREVVTRSLAALGALVVSGVLVAANFKEFSLIGREHGELRLLLNPVSPVYAGVTYLRRSLRGPREVAVLAPDAHRTVGPARHRPLLVVLVVGETARAASFSLNGYARPTNPLLARLPVIDFTDVESCGTSTAVSVPCMFSPLGRSGYSDRKAKSQQSLLDVLQRVGVAVLWSDNNSGCKGTCDRVPRESGSDLGRPDLCTEKGCFDEVLLEGLTRFVESAPGDAFVVLHMKGSHGPAYHLRSPEAFKRFVPECDDADVRACERQAIVNAYDNTIVYTDFVLSRLIGLLEGESRRFDVAMLYVSDHGESLGENGLYLHGMPFWLAPDEQTRVPMLLWLSTGFEAGQGIDRACLDARRHEPLSHDNLFHSMLGLFSVRAKVYEPALDLFRPCRAAPAPVTVAR